MVYFGGKSRIAPTIWSRLGSCDRYIEPFFGSGAVLLANPHYAGTFEVVNDIDNYLANVWRALRDAPDDVARFADRPVNEIDLHLNHLWLVNEGAEILKQCEYDEQFFSAEAAGRWLMGNANWIGVGFCSGRGPWTLSTLALAAESKNYNHRHYLRDEEKGIHRKLPHLGDDGHGVNRQLPHLGDGGEIIPCNAGLYEYLRRIARRLKKVRVCCGDWSRITGPAVTQIKSGTCAVLFDPPYSSDCDEVYTHDSWTVSHDVREWCKNNGDNPNFRIALCGHDGEHNELEELGWDVVEWSTKGGYGSQAQAENSRGKINKDAERVWFSPHCLSAHQRGLFG